MSSTHNPSTLLQLARQIHTLKHLPRTGWLARGIPVVESVGAHSWGTALWAMWIAQRPLKPPRPDLQKLLSMVLLHDLPEASTGDLMPSQKIALFGPDPQTQRDAIHSAELRFWELMAATSTRSSEDRSEQIDETESSPLEQIQQSNIWDEWRALWAEYREGVTVEAKIVKQADALDCVMQAIVYQQLHQRSLHDFARLITKAAGGDSTLEAELTALWRESRQPQTG